MKRAALLSLALLCLIAPGCARNRAQPDQDIARFPDAWETPRLPQQTFVLDFKAEKTDEGPRLFDDVLNVLIDSGKFRRAHINEIPSVYIEVTATVDERTRLFEAFAVLRTPSGEVLGRCYAQGRDRGKRQQRNVQLDTFKALTVKMCRALMPEAKQ